MSSNYIDLPVEGGGGGGSGVASINSLTGALTLVGGPNITIGNVGNVITISSTALPIAIISINGSTFANQTLVAGTAGSDFNIADSAPGIHTFNLPTASASNRGALSTSDWSTFNNKQPAGNYITSLTGDGTASGPGSAAFTLANTTVSPGSYSYANITVDSKGRITAASSNAAPPGGTVTSVALTSPGVLYTVSGSPITSSGTLALNLIPQNPNTILAGPASGSAANPSFRSLVSADIPNNAANTTGTASNITASSNSTLTSLPSLALPTSQLSGQLSLTTQVSGILPIANGGTNNSSTYTAGSIIFSNGTSLTQDNANFFWNDANSSIGIGTNVPASNAFIDGVNTTLAAKRIQLTGYGLTSTVGYGGRFARGTSGTPAAVQSGDILNFLSGQGYGTSQFPSASTGVFNVIAGETFTNASNLTYATVNATPAGSVTSAEAFRVATTGTTLGPQSGSTAIHSINGGLNRTTKTITANYTVDTTTTDDIIYCNAAGAVSVTLPAPALGRSLTIKDISGNATTNNITIARHAAENIEGVAASYLIQVSYGTVILGADGTNWWIIG